MSIKAVNRNSKWWRRQSWHRSVKKCGQSVKYCSTANQLKWEVSNWSKQLTSITTSGFSYCNFVSDEVSMEIWWHSDQYVLLLKAILLTRQEKSCLIEHNIMLLSCISIVYTCSTIWNQSLLPVFLYLYPATEHWDIGHLAHMIFANNNKTVYNIVFWNTRWYNFSYYNKNLSNL